MPRTEIPIIQSARGNGTSVTWTPADASNGMYYDNAGENIELWIRTGATDTTPTINAEGSIDGRGIEDAASTAVGTNAYKVFGPYPGSPYENVSGQITVDFTADTDVYVCAVKAASLALASS